MKLPSREEMIARFWELKAKRDAQHAKAEPHHEAVNKLVAKHDKERAVVDAKRAEAMKGLAEIETEMAMLVRATGGKMGEDPNAK